MAAAVPQTHLVIAGQFVDQKVNGIRRAQDRQNNAALEESQAFLVRLGLSYSMNHISTSEFAGSDFTPEGTISKAFAWTKDKMFPEP